jgi:hydrogenase maturation protease
MKEVLVLGIGNRLMMDDGIGVYVVETLKKRNTKPGIRYVIGETDIYFCLDQIENASYIIIVDAACFDNEPGTISTIPLEQFTKKPIQQISSHDSHLLDEIKISGKGIGGVFIGIEPNEVNYCPNLSTKLQEQFIKVVEEIESIIVSYAYGGPQGL